MVGITPLTSAPPPSRGEACCRATLQTSRGSRPGFRVGVRSAPAPGTCQVPLDIEGGQQLRRRHPARVANDNLSIESIQVTRPAQLVADARRV